MEKQWLEVRSTAADLLGNYPFLVAEGPEERSEGRFEGALSIVIEADPSKKKRRLPSLYVGTYQVFAHRDVVEVLKRFLLTVEAVRTAVNAPIYAAHPCEVDGVRGLYARDFFARESYRRKLARRGMSFTDDPYVRLLPDGGFECADWGPFEPRFMVMPNIDFEVEGGVVQVQGAPLLFNTLGLRLGRAQPDELYLLRPVLERIYAVGSSDPDALLADIRDAPV